MEMIRKLWLFHLMTVLCCLHNVSSLSCYSCSSSIGHGAACEDISLFTSAISHQECDNNAVCATYQIKHDNDIIIYRSCKKPDVCLGLSKRYNSQYNQLLNCQTCSDDDFCNSAVTRYSIPVSTKLIVFVLISCLILHSIL